MKPMTRLMAMMMQMPPSRVRVPGLAAARHWAPLMLPTTPKPPTVAVTMTEVRML